MVLKILKWFLVAVVGIVVGFVVILTLGSQLSLDHDYTHTRETESLPAFTLDIGSGLVTIAANDFKFRARVAGFNGNPDGEQEKPGVILLHGFPVTSAMWTGLIGALEDAGYRVIAFDQRGYSPGARPDDLGAYTTDHISSDVIAVADAAGLERFHLVGHDWGAMAGWVTVLTHPQRLLSWTGLSIAHPTAFSTALANDPDQQARSGYFLFFQTPWLPESMFSFNGFSMLKSLYRDMSPQQTMEYLSVFGEPGAMTASLNWYRATNIRRGQLGQFESEVNTPTLFIWGNNDSAVGRVAIEQMAQYMKGPYRQIELDAGHWLMEESPLEVTEAILKHLATFNKAPSI